MTTMLAANWKMNPVTATEAIRLARASLKAATAVASRVEVVLFPPFPWLREVAAIVQETVVRLGAQDCYWATAGAFTGEVSAAMLAGWCPWVIVGHSERRALFCESAEQVSRKARASLEAGLRVIVCVGDREEQFAAGETAEVVCHQVSDAVTGLNPVDSSRLAIAYEPLWAIGSGHNAEPAEVSSTLELVRGVVGEILGDHAAADVRVLYGGSVNASDVASYVALAGCDGCLVGGASLQSQEFVTMIHRAAATAR